MGGGFGHDESYEYEPWYKYGIGFLVFEALIAVGVSIYALSMGFSGQAVQFKKKVTFDRPAAVIETDKAKQCKALERQYQECMQDAGLTITVPSKK